VVPQSDGSVTLVSMDVDLTGRRVLITGAGQGVGLGIARGFAAAGAEIIVNDIVAARAAEVVAELVDGGTVASAAVFDVTDFDAVSTAVDASGGVDVLVNNAGNAGVEGMAGRVAFADSDPADWDRYVRINLYGVMHCTRAVLPAMIDRRWGRVITIVSDAGRTGDKYLAAYSAAKAGAAGLSRAVALETGQFGVTANNISLGTMRTPMTEPLWADPDSLAAKSILQRYAVRRPGLPNDVAPLAVFLASEHASWITGQTYPVNGGYSFSV
jgi:NAD(P)-dependent dehydrogenase (short-subunit alcohol dehydrogenase family)